VLPQAMRSWGELAAGGGVLAAGGGVLGRRELALGTRRQPVASARGERCSGDLVADAEEEQGGAGHQGVLGWGAAQAALGQELGQGACWWSWR
jgi:hypothetical protein